MFRSRVPHFAPLELLSLDSIHIYKHPAPPERNAFVPAPMTRRLGGGQSAKTIHLDFPESAEDAQKLKL